MNDDPDSFTVRACRTLLAGVDDLVVEVAAVIEGTEPAYGASDLIDHRELTESNRANLVAVLEHLCGATQLGLDTARATGRRRAELGVPLEAVLRAYRLGTRAVWDRIVTMAGDDPDAKQELLDSASEIWRLVDDVSQALTFGFQEWVTAQAHHDARLRDAAVDVLLSGNADAVRRRESADRLRLPQTGDFVVICARSTSTATETIPGIGAALTALGVRSAWRVRPESQVGIVALTATFTVERLQAALTERTLGPTGIGPAQSGLSGLSDALRLAELTSLAAQSMPDLVVRHEQALLPVLLAGAPDLASGIATARLGQLLGLSGNDRDVLLQTLRAWYDCAGEVSAVARTLFCHRNTVRFRLNRVTELTGFDPATPLGAAELYLALHAHDISVAK
ncbi:PucR family transcriptional regulator [Nocardia jejuensis]|uniref:PucR family transcriptional regulator n=1 Tax=Nocardia jejuensis TaxID=328049 RepID=UPI000835CA2C|nr:helix-turn-helix domain-containing protein [Nocardia jejuensis]